MKKKVTNWGNYPIVEANISHQTNYRELKKEVLQKDKIIARGNGRCYGDASLQNDIISTLKLNHFLHFDQDKGIIHVESGVLLSEILDFIVPKAYFLPVTPGTKFITIGGAIAADVHGKNHHKEGSFSQYVHSFKLLKEDGEIIHCSKEENQDIFYKTFGAMGLTGVILSAEFQLKKIETAYIRNESIQANNLEEIYKWIEDSEDWTYTVAWIDCLQKGQNIGKSLMMRGEHATLNELPETLKKEPLKNKNKTLFSIPFFFPPFILSNFSIKIFNFLFYNKQLKKHLKNYIHYDAFFYPLDTILEWNKIYGKKGFIQYQFVIPSEFGLMGMKKILEVIAESGNGSFLVVLKRFGKTDAAFYNSFPEEGYTLALDFKMNKQLPNLVAQLDTLVLEYKGKIYRAKDAMSDPLLTNYLKGIDSEKFQSHQSERISG